MNRSLRLPLYWIMRVLAIGFGLLLLTSGAVLLFRPDVLHSGGPAPSRLATSTRGVTYVVLAVALLLPYRLRLPPALSRARATLVVIAALLVTYLAGDGLVAYFRGERHWLILPTLATTLLAGWSGVGALVLKRSGAAPPVEGG